jgi:hypothetical protein
MMVAARSMRWALYLPLEALVSVGVVPPAWALDLVLVIDKPLCWYVMNR